MAGLLCIGTNLLLILIVVAVLTCCGIPLLLIDKIGLIDKTVHSLFSQYMLLSPLDDKLDMYINNPIDDGS